MLSTLQANQSNPTSNPSPTEGYPTSSAEQSPLEDKVQNENQSSPPLVKQEDNDDCVITREGRASLFTILKLAYSNLLKTRYQMLNKKNRNLVEKLANTINSPDDEVDANDAGGSHDPPAHSSQLWPTSGGATPTKASLKRRVITRSPDTSVPGSTTEKI